MFRRHSKNAALPALIGIALLGAACGGSSPTGARSQAPTGTPTSAPTSSGPTASTVKATERDFKVTLAQATVPTGSITFQIHNNGPSTHEFVVFKTDLPQGALPVDSSTSQVDEKGQGVQPVDEVQEVAAGGDQTLTVDLAPGNYVVFCNLPTHYGLGMHASLAVTG